MLVAKKNLKYETKIYISKYDLNIKLIKINHELSRLSFFNNYNKEISIPKDINLKVSHNMYQNEHNNSFYISTYINYKLYKGKILIGRIRNMILKIYV